AIILYRGICVAVQCTDSFSALLAAGLTLIVALQGLFNMSVAAGLVPTTGVPLPLVSLGGSSLVTTLAAMGFLLSIAAGGGVVSFSGRQSSSASSSSSLRENPGGEA
ncbi:MAG: FtsW/RodA/SpoVE family cell cycle protein, partial [Nitrospinaceae bacterium]|nr:FtsW/RodA/SpoVE family cell cycle protein [Nitrospinaceae bacterium]